MALPIETLSQQYNLPPVPDILYAPEYQYLLPHLGKYLTNVTEAGVSVEHADVAAQAVGKYLEILRAQGAAELSVFLLPTDIDPYETAHPGDPVGRNLIANWEDSHIAIGMANIENVIGGIRETMNGAPGETYIHFGSMYADKTGRILRTVHELYNRLWRRKLGAYIADAMEEDVIKTRIGGRPGLPLRSTLELPAIRVNGPSLFQALIEGDYQAGDVVVIDEVSFVSFDNDQCLMILRLLQELNQRGVTVLASGLNMDYRGQDLPMKQAADFMEGGVQVVNCHAFHAYNNPNGELRTGNHQSMTFRYDMRAGFGDLLMPVPIGRVHGDIVQYRAVPPQAHIFGLLQQYEPILHQELLQIGQSQDLLEYNIALGTNED